MEKVFHAQREFNFLCSINSLYTILLFSKWASRDAPVSRACSAIAFNMYVLRYLIIGYFQISYFIYPNGFLIDLPLKTSLDKAFRKSNLLIFLW